MKRFIEFIQAQGIVGLAVGFLLGGAVSKVVTALVEDIINPLVGIVIGAVGSFDEAYFRVGSAKIMYGHFIGALIDFIIIAMVVFYIFKGLADKIDKRK